MSHATMRLRLTALATASALALATAPASWAAPPPIAPRGDPPIRVARLARANGTVSFHTADADHWSPAPLNTPISAGDAFWTEAGARADIQLADNRIVLAPTTELDLSSLDEHALATSEPQGETYVNLRQVPPSDSYAVQTPRGVVQMTVAGRYDVVAGDADHPTLVTVVDGAATVTGPNLSLQIGPRQTATLTGAGTVQGSVGPLAQDPFLTAMLAEDRPAPRATVPIPPIVQQMTGAEDLDSEGQWQETPQYGSVWYPPVEAGWVPYRHGHWSYVAPWGWTWVDDASWGFAPFHYGRWVQMDNRWGWIPVTPGAVPFGRVPVYAPALVSFVDLGGAALAGAAVGFAAGALAGRSIGWVPLGPREPYYPPYRTNLAYVRSLNAPNVQNVNQSITTVNVVNNRSVVNNFINRGAATLVPATAMVQSAPIAAANRAFSPDQMGRAQAQFRAPFSPGPATVGVTPAVARQFNFVPPSRPAQPVPGPAIRPALLRPAPGAPPALPALRAAGGPAAAPPIAAERPGEPRAPARIATEPRPAPQPNAPRPGFHAVPQVERAAPPQIARPMPPQAVRPPQAAAQPEAPAFHPPPAPRPQAAPQFHAPPPPRPAAAPQPHPAAPPPHPPAPRPHPEGREEHRP